METNLERYERELSHALGQAASVAAGHDQQAWYAIAEVYRRLADAARRHEAD